MNTSDIEKMTSGELAAAIRHNNVLYWEKGAPEISDEDYDLLVRELAGRDPDNPLLEEISAAAVESSGKIIHEKPMLSLDKAYSIEEVMAWGAKFVRKKDEPLLVQPKYDGISAAWHNGVLATRGDGFSGENITDKLSLVELEHPSGTMPLASFRADARGEIVIRTDDFRTLYSKIRNRTGRVYKNPRNAVAGIMGLKDTAEMLAQGAKLTLVDYSLISWKTVYCSLESVWPEILEKAELLPYPMDGIVIKLADEVYSESLGSTAHHPRGQIAFKFSGIRRTSRLLDVEWSFGKNCLTPVAEIEPVEIGGTTIRHASLHNLQNVLDKDLHIGDTVTVERAGDVIPHIVSSEPGETRRSCLIEKCPSCGGTLVRALPELKCVNPDCFMTRLKLLTASVKAIGIENLGEPNVKKMMRTLQVKTLNDIFNLTLNDILRLESFKAASANNLLREIESARHVPDWQLLASLNIPSIGPSIARNIMSAYTLDELCGLSEEKLARIATIGPERANALKRELAAQHDYITGLRQCVSMTVTKGGSEARPKICFTGKMPEKRSYYENLSRAAGYEPAETVTADLALLVADDVNGNSSKLVKARKNSVRIISLDDFMKESASHVNAAVSKEKKSGADVPVQDLLF